MVWFLAACFAIVTYTPQLTCSGIGCVLGKRSQTEIRSIKCEQIDTTDTKKVTAPVSLAPT